MFTALYPSFVLVKHDLLMPELNQRLAEIAIEDAARHRVVDDDDPRNLGTSHSPFGHIRHNLLAEHRGDTAVEAWLAVARASLAEYLHRGFGAELPESLMAISEPFLQGEGYGETIGIFTHTHPKADVVVTYYPEVNFGDVGPERFREGALRFYDPAGRGHRLWPNRNPAIFTGSWLDVRPRTGTLVIFEGHVPHDSAPFTGKRRVCLPLQVSLRFPNAQNPVEIGGSSHGL
jgi:hypothetical protein